MGTNYYLRPEPECPTCKRPYDEVHVGKHSYGWSFCFDPHCSTFQDWKKLIKENDGKLFDEYERPISAADFLALVESLKDKPTHYQHDDARHFYIDPDGYRFSKSGGFS